MAVYLRVSELKYRDDIWMGARILPDTTLVYLPRVFTCFCTGAYHGWHRPSLGLHQYRVFRSVGILDGFQTCQQFCNVGSYFGDASPIILGCRKGAVRQSARTRCRRSDPPPGTDP